MRIIYLYGPPGVGKLTVANTLAKNGNFRVFHNHLTVDLVEAIFPLGTSEYDELVQNIRLLCFQKIAAHPNYETLIFTHAFNYEKNKVFLENLYNISKSADLKLHFVKLVCDQIKLEERIVSIDRKKYNKIVSVQVLRKKLSEFDYSYVIPGSAIIDTSLLTPIEISKLILEQLDDS